MPRAKRLYRVHSWNQKQDWYRDYQGPAAAIDAARVQSGLGRNVEILKSEIVQFQEEPLVSWPARGSA